MVSRHLQRGPQAGTASVIAAVPQAGKKRVMIVSRHDYRTGRRASIHFLAQAIAEQGHEVRFVSVGFSWMSRLRRDRRCVIADRANCWEVHDGVHAFLWKTPWHAFDIPLFGAHTGWLYDLWAQSPGAAFDEAAAGSDTIIVESGIAPVFIQRLRDQAPTAKLIYRAADLLDTAGVHPRIQHILERDAAEIDLVVVVARDMLPHFEQFPGRKLLVMHGVDRAQLEAKTENPYATPRNIVTVGSMLFDATVVRAAASALPQWTFHLIGTPQGPFAANVRQYGEMPFSDTLRYLHHADVGLAPYRRGPGAEYLVDSSLKLLQFSAMGLPAACPGFAASDRPLRFGYDPDQPDTAAAALLAAAQAPRTSVSIPDWADVAHRLMDALHE
jgi:2-beta-glucuronyltransferase